MNVMHDKASIAHDQLKIVKKLVINRTKVENWAKFVENCAKFVENCAKFVENHAQFFAIFQVFGFAIFQARTNHQNLDEALY